MSKIIQTGFAFLLISIILFIFMWIGIFFLDLFSYIEQYGIYGFFFWPLIKGNEWTDWTIQIIWICVLIGIFFIIIGAIKSMFGKPLFHTDFIEEELESLKN